VSGIMTSSLLSRVAVSYFRQQLDDQHAHERATLPRGEDPGSGRAAMRCPGRSDAGASGSVASALRSFRLLLSCAPSLLLSHRPANEVVVLPST
jgi:hypothetical protein